MNTVYIEDDNHKIVLHVLHDVLLAMFRKWECRDTNIGSRLLRDEKHKGDIIYELKYPKGYERL